MFGFVLMCLGMFAMFGCIWIPFRWLDQIWIHLDMCRCMLVHVYVCIYIYKFECIYLGINSWRRTYINGYVNKRNSWLTICVCMSKMVAYGIHM